ncbi:MAG: hybrid sensor histidine kinase/response regulator [Gemmatimonadota bacterium]|nr:hybrid sensor histidine kinase/response regulator [Gemmatimonadota bacterium]
MASELNAGPCLRFVLAPIPRGRPEYWWSGSAKIVTAVTSVATAVALPPLVPRIMGVLRDARTSQRRRHALEAANRELEELNRRLTESERTRTDFFANVSHELRTPLTLILGPLDQLSGSGSLDAVQQRSVAVIERNAQQLLSRVDDLLDVARMEWTEPTAEPQPMDLAELTRWVAEGFTGAAHSRNISFEILAPRALPATLDPNMVERIVLNLLSNAFKFTPDGGRIVCTVEVEPSDPTRSDPRPRARIVVADNGPGIAPGEREAVFDRFRRFDDASSPSGSGLGLAIVQEFTTALGGSATVSETEGGGATLTITLPFETPDEPASEDQTGARAAGHHPNLQDGSGTVTTQELVSGPPIGADPLAAPIEAVGTVLVVDDNEDLCRYLATVLGTTYRVYAALDGSAGLTRTEELRPDLIITDMMMPRLTGDELLAALQEHTHLRDIPVMVLTARTDAALPAHMLRFGALDFLTKPVQADELRERVRNLVDMARTRRILEKDADRSQRQLHELAAGSLQPSGRRSSAPRAGSTT